MQKVQQQKQDYATDCNFEGNQAVFHGPQGTPFNARNFENMATYIITKINQQQNGKEGTRLAKIEYSAPIP